MKEIPVAKSTLSLWLRDIGLSKRQTQKITKKKLDSARRGSEARRKQRIELSKKLIREAKDEVKSITKNELFLIGVSLYWAEGAKQKEHSPSERVSFSNSDPEMIKIFIKWLKLIGVSDQEIEFDIYLHENHKNRAIEIKKYWANQTGFPIAKFGKIYYKKEKVRTNRKNIGVGYFGLIKTNVRKSTNLNRKIHGWTEGIIKQCPMV